MNILVTSARAFISVDIIRVLSQQGHKVWTVDSLACPIAKYSSYIKSYSEEKYIKIPAPKLNFHAFSQAIIDICHKNSIDFIIPTSEEIFYLAQIKNLPEHTKLQSINIEKLNNLHNKASFAELANNLGYGSGDFLVANSSEQLKDILHEISQNLKNYVAKPIYSRFANNALVSPSIEQIKNIQPTENCPWLFQKRMIGQEICLYCVASEGELLAHVAYFPEFRTNLHGASLYFSPINFTEYKELSVNIKKMAQDFIKHTNFTGQISFDIINTTNGLVPIECNPRGTSGVHLLSQQPQLFANSLLGINTKSYKTNEIDIIDNFSYKPMMLFFPILLKHPTSVFNPRKLKLLKNAQNVLKNNDISVIKSIISISEIFAISLHNKISFTEATTFDIEWNGERYQ